MNFQPGLLIALRALFLDDHLPYFRDLEYGVPALLLLIYVFLMVPLFSVFFARIFLWRMTTNLLDRIKNDDVSAFNQVYSAYHAKLYSYLKLKTRADFLAEEIVQLTFIRFWERRAKLPAEVEISLQLFGMARQIMLGELRKEAVRLRRNEQATLSPLAESLIKAVENRDLIRHFEKEIEKQPRMRKMIYELSRKQGFSHKEIAEILSISPRTVESHIAKVLSALKHYMYLFTL